VESVAERAWITVGLAISAADRVVFSGAGAAVPFRSAKLSFVQGGFGFACALVFLEQAEGGS